MFASLRRKLRASRTCCTHPPAPLECPSVSSLAPVVPGALTGRLLLVHPSTVGPHALREPTADNRAKDYVIPEFLVGLRNDLELHCFFYCQIFGAGVFLNILFL